MLEEEKSKARLDGHVGRVGRGFYKTKPNSTFGSHWDPEKVHHVPGYRNPVVYQAKMKERQAALKLQGTAHTPNIHTSEMGALKRETARTARKKRSPKVKVNRTLQRGAEGHANLVEKKASESHLMAAGFCCNFKPPKIEVRIEPKIELPPVEVNLPVNVPDPVALAKAGVAEVKKKGDEFKVFLKTGAGQLENFFEDAADWTEAAAKSAVKNTVRAVQDIEKFTEATVDWVQDAAENVGNFVVGAAKAGKEWFLGFLSQIMKKLIEAGEGFSDKVTKLAGGAVFPGAIKAFDPIAKIFSDIGNIMRDVVTAVGPDLVATGEKIGSAIAAFFSDEDLFSGIFGQLGLSVISGLNNVITGQSPLNAQTALSELNKIKKICASYLKKYFVPLVSAIQWLGNQIAVRVKAALDSLNAVIQQFLEGLGNGLTWYIGICGDLSIDGGDVELFVGTCTLFPFTINGGSDTFSLNSITQEFSIGSYLSLTGLPSDVGFGKYLGIRIGYIVTNDQTAVQGPAVGRAIEANIETFGPWPDVGTFLSITSGLDETVLSIDLGISAAFNERSPFEVGISTAYAYGWAPFEAVESALQPKTPYSSAGVSTSYPGGQNVLLAQHIGRTSALFQRSAVTGNIREHVLQHFHNLTEERRNPHDLQLAGKHFYNVTHFTGRNSDSFIPTFTFPFPFWTPPPPPPNVDDLIRVSGSSVDGNVRLKYGVFQKSLCLPGAAIFSLAECQEAKRILENSGTIGRGSAIAVGGWQGVPAGCCVQNGISVHFGTFPNTDESRLLSGEFATICRRLYKLAPEKQKECPSGSGITSAKQCKEAFYELQGKFNDPPSEGFRETSTEIEVPFGCSGRRGPPGFGNSPWFKPYGADFTHLANGNFQGICKATRYWLERAGMRSCPVGSHITTSAECGEAYKQLKQMFRYPNRRGLIEFLNPGWEGVPRGCSIQIGSIGPDNTPHFNGNTRSKGERGLLNSADPNGDFAGQAEFQSICKEPSFWRPDIDGQQCPEGTTISGHLACKAAYESLRDTFPVPATRRFVSGSWAHVPRGCSATSATESSPHSNSYAYRSPHTTWSPMCWPGRYYIPAPGSSRCPLNQQVNSKRECREALLALLPVLQAEAGAESIVPSRGVVTADDSNGLGSNGVFNSAFQLPQYCSYQAGGDYAAHFNCGFSFSTNPGYRPICKILVPNVDPPPNMFTCDWQN